MNLSFEFFPPKDLDFLRVAECFNDLSVLDPKFISITYGALGNSEEKSLGLIKEIKNLSSIEIAAHLTLVNKSKDQINHFSDFTRGCKPYQFALAKSRNAEHQTGNVEYADKIQRRILMSAGSLEHALLLPCVSLLCSL